MKVNTLDSNKSSSSEESKKVYIIVKQTSFITLDEDDTKEMMKKFEFIDENDIKAEQQYIWRQRDLMVTAPQADLTMRIHKLNEELILISEKTHFEQYFDFYNTRLSKQTSPFSKSITRIQIFRLVFVEACRRIVTSIIFERVTLFVIVMNSIYLAIDDQMMQDNKDEQVQFIRKNIENTFAILYIMEFCLKICALGFIFNQNAYIRDYWNLIDFMIIIQVILTWTVYNNKVGFNLNALRALRILIPLKSLRTVEGLRVLVVSLIHALPLLRDTMVILGFFYLLFALIGLHHFHGDFKNRCFYIETGQLHLDEILCSSDQNCPDSYICGKALILNLNNDQTSFDNIFYALLTVFQCVTLEGWSQIMVNTMKTTNSLSFLFFIALIFLGSFFMVNLTLAVINNKFTEAHNFYEEQRRINDINQKSKHRGLSLVAELQNKLAAIDKEGQDMDEHGENNDTLSDPQKKNLKKLMQTGLTIRHFIIGKRAAKQMINFLRLRQSQKNNFMSLAQVSRRRKTIAQNLITSKIQTNESMDNNSSNVKADPKLSLNTVPTQQIVFPRHAIVGRPSVFLLQPSIVEEESQSESFDINASNISSSNQQSNGSSQSGIHKGSYNPNADMKIQEEQSSQEQSIISKIVISEESKQEQKVGILQNKKIRTSLAEPGNIIINQLEQYQSKTQIHQTMHSNPRSDNYKTLQIDQSKTIDQPYKSLEQNKQSKKTFSSIVYQDDSLSGHSKNYIQEAYQSKSSTIEVKKSDLPVKIVIEDISSQKNETIISNSSFAKTNTEEKQIQPPETQPTIESNQSTHKKPKVHRNTVVARDLVQLQSFGARRQNVAIQDTGSIRDLRKESYTSNLTQQTKHYRFSRFLAPPINPSPYEQNRLVNKLGASPTPLSRQLSTYQRGSVLSTMSHHSTSTMNKPMSLIEVIRMKSMLHKQSSITSDNSEGSKVLEMMIDTKTQKIVLKPGQEYFSSSHIDVLENRLQQKSKIISSIVKPIKS